MRGHIRVDENMLNPTRFKTYPMPEVTLGVIRGHNNPNFLQSSLQKDNLIVCSGIKEKGV